MTATLCQHHRILTRKGEWDVGVCKHCGDERLYPVDLEDQRLSYLLDAEARAKAASLKAAQNGMRPTAWGQRGNKKGWNAMRLKAKE